MRERGCERGVVSADTGKKGDNYTRIITEEPPNF